VSYSESWWVIVSYGGVEDAMRSGGRGRWNTAGDGGGCGSVGVCWDWTSSSNGLGMSCSCVSSMEGWGFLFSRFSRPPVVPFAHRPSC